MGFGVLFLGYLITYVGSITPVYAFTQFFGVLIMLYGLSKLARHNKYFATTFGVSVAYLAQSVYTVIGYFSVWETGSLLYQIEQYSRELVVFVFHLFLLLAIREIADFTSLPKLKSRAVVNLITTALFCILNVLLHAGAMPESVLSYAFLLSLLLRIFWVILNAALVFSCYMWICLEGEENMDKSPLNIPFLNTINDAMNHGLDKLAERRAEKNREYINTKKKKKK
ncbi:MAG: hypothetical protein J6D21_05655 [Clostridia bacterium]|nr:hypothetical protein [Clostridia bacterium]